MTVRSSPAKKVSPSEARNFQMPLEFKGDTNEYFRIWIVNLCLTFMTLGVFSAWAKVRKKRYFYSHTVLDGTPYQYLGKPVPILIGRIIGVTLLLTYYLSRHFFTATLPFVLALGLILAPWMLMRSAAFNARYSSFRNITFDFKATYFSATNAILAWGTSLFFVATVLLGLADQIRLVAAASSLMLLTFPLWLRGLKSFVVTHSSYGGKKAQYIASRREYYGNYIVAVMITLVVMVLGVALATVGLKHFGRTATKFFLFLGYFGYATAYVYLQTHITNLNWKNTRVGPLHFESGLEFFGMLRLYLTNGIAILGSAGLLIPWAVIRTQKYKADRLKVFRDGDLLEFRGRRVQSVQAIGAETMELFDMDISL